MFGRRKSNAEVQGLIDREYGQLINHWQDTVQKMQDASNKSLADCQESNEWVRGNLKESNVTIHKLEETIGVLRADQREIHRQMDVERVDMRSRYKELRRKLDQISDRNGLYVGSLVRIAAHAQDQDFKGIELVLSELDKADDAFAVAYAQIPNRSV